MNKLSKLSKAQENTDDLNNDLHNDNLNQPDVNSQPLQQPTQGTKLVYEYTAEGYIIMTFSCLFPYEKSDLQSESKQQID